MSENKYSVGEVVKLNAGGPDMSVLQVLKRDGGQHHYNCQWFAGKKLEAGRFPEESLIKVVPKADSNEG